MEQIDILLATYNGEKYIEEQIQSILNQTYQNFRLIISDDCSKDNTIEIIKKIAEQEKRIIIYEQKKNLGYVKNFEFLLTKVENDLYMLSDQDDIWLPEKIEKSYNKLKCDNADLVFTDLEVVDENLKTIYPSFNDYMKLSRKIKKYCGDYRLQYLYNCITGCTILSRKVFIKDILPIPKDSKYVIHDTWIGLIVSMYGKVTYLNEKTIKYRQHGNNQVGTDKISHKFKKAEDVRKLFIDVKIDLFNTYVNNNNKFSESLRKINLNAVQYFNKVKTKKYVNIEKMWMYFVLYRYERSYDFIVYFLIFNIPIVFNFIFLIRNKILRRKI